MEGRESERRGGREDGREGEEEREKRGGKEDGREGEEESERRGGREGGRKTSCVTCLTYQTLN